MRGTCADNHFVSSRLDCALKERIPPVPVVRTANQESPPAPSQAELQRIMHMRVPVIVRLAERKLSMQEIMRLGVGAIIEFVRSSDEPLELLVNNKTIGTGEAVKVGENFGLKITQVGDVKELIRSMGSKS